MDTIIKNTRFNSAGKTEREFELAFMSAVAAYKDRIKGTIHRQVDKDTIARSVYLFGKRHQPDLTINEDGIAIEIKFLSNSLDILDQAISQSIIHRVRHLCATSPFAIDIEGKETYFKDTNEDEKSFEEIRKDLWRDTNVSAMLIQPPVPAQI